MKGTSWGWGGVLGMWLAGLLIGAGIGIDFAGDHRTHRATDEEWASCDWPIFVESGKDFDGKTDLNFYWCGDGRMMARDAAEEERLRELAEAEEDRREELRKKQK